MLNRSFGGFIQKWKNQLDDLRKELKECVQLEKAEEVIEAAKKYQQTKSQGDQVRTLLQQSKNRKEPEEKVKTLQEEVDKIEEGETLKANEFQGLVRPLVLEVLPTELAKYELLLMKGAILSQILRRNGSFHRLQQFCKEDPIKHPELIETLLSDPSLMKQMLTNGGPTNSNWGPAMKIYMEIRPLIKNDKFEKQHTKLALAVALEHAAPIAEYDTPNIKVNPIERFKHFVQAHRNGELDFAFCHFSAWEYRMIVDCNATNEQMQWGRDSLKRYRPDQINMGTNWRYAICVKSDLGYRQPNWTSSPRTYQQMMSGGGKCGPRAWYGRFICKAHGIPTWGVRQPGHAAVSRWTSSPDGWITQLGGGWKKSYWDDRKGEDFKKEAHARAFCSNGNKDEKGDEDKFFYHVTLLECMAEVMNECSNLEAEKLGACHPNHLWRSLRTGKLRNLRNQADETTFQFPEEKGLVDTQLQQLRRRTDKPEHDNVIEVSMNGGEVKIPACAYDGKKSRHARSMRTFDCEGGGGQIIMSDHKGILVFTIPNQVKAGNYEVTCKVCTMHLQQHLLHVSVDEKEDLLSQVPYTIGEWGMTAPVPVTLGPGSLLKFRRTKGPCFGLTIKEVRLTPC